MRNTHIAFLNTVTCERKVLVLASIRLISEMYVSVMKAKFWDTYRLCAVVRCRRCLNAFSITCKGELRSGSNLQRCFITNKMVSSLILTKQNWPSHSQEIWSFEWGCFVMLEIVKKKKCNFGISGKLMKCYVFEMNFDRSHSFWCFEFKK